MSSAVASLEMLARTDASVAPLALLQAVALEAAADPSWEDGVPRLTTPAGSAAGTAASSGGAPLLHGLTLTVDSDHQRALLRRLAATLATSSTPEARPLDALFGAADFDPLVLLAASVPQDTAAIEAISRRAGIDSALLAVVGHAATLPLLLACGRRTEHQIESITWQHGYCPLCAAWPILAEIRGLARDFVLRCGRCASAWHAVQHGCVFCGKQDQQSQDYFAAEHERETRRANVCDACHGYLKTIATLGALDISELLLHDLQSLELDVTALDNGYCRPDAPGWVLDVRIEPAPSREVPSNGSWRRLWR